MTILENATQLKLLVYGTLKYGHPNHFRIDQYYINKEDVTLHDYLLLNHSGLPYIIPKKHSEVACEI